ncbi:DUF3320 domain-containing protein [Butyrivibrio sp. INlla14]|uniref:DUF3320 domain-containing protein n=1 Tax=Butyrivibrio sp. INlla14 TaxID=1520808 RepID=UPI0008760A94|nr:DUF3320 domain-containing protein [Butyrivibrio sp. INlla14]SCY63061.1 SWIM zinc finger [Butyrivibrio sp. INlla14]
MEWKHLFKENVLNGGMEYIRSGSVKNLHFDERLITADIVGLESYHVEIVHGINMISKVQCNCPYAQSGIYCKHMAAALFAWENETVNKEAVSTPQSTPVEEIETVKESVEEKTSDVVAEDKKADDIKDVTPPEPIETEEDKKELSEEEKKIIISKAQNGIELTVDVEEVITYAIQQNGGDVVRDIVVKNTLDEDLSDIVLKIGSDTKLIEPCEVGIQTIRADEEIHLKELKIKINGDYLASLTERITCSLQFRVCFDDKTLISDKKDIVALAFDQWPGLRYTPEILAAFSMPNHPVVTSLIQLAAKYLEKWTGDPSLAGYQFDDPNRVKLMAAAAYAAIQQKNITYANPPSSFEVFGQRIRLADAVLEQHLGTCMDMTLLYVACLEAMGLNPVMVLIHGHIFAGVWLVEDSFSDTIMDDPSHMEKRMANGINEMIVVECTAMCAGKSLDFDKAVKSAQYKVADYGNFEFVIDVARARSLGIRPLPVRIMTDAGFVVKHEERKQSEVTSAPISVGQTFDLSNLKDESQATKLTQWERKLLDLSMRNMLINLRFTKAVVPLLCSNVSVLEDALSDGEEFQVLPRPDNMAINGDGISVEALTDLGPFQEFMELENKHKKLHSFYTEKELSSCLTKMYRSAKTSLEENGASTLYLSLGLLRWVEGKKTPVVRYAPIILVPIDITRKSASIGYTMRMRDEDAQMNITLLEFLKQNFDLQIAGLNPLPTDEHGLDLPKIFAIVRHGIMSMEMWDVLEAGFISNFSFSQFVMWNDIHSRSDILERNNIVRSLMKGAVDWDCTIPDNVDTDEAYLPITADASQIRAINMAANDVSFVLHGPPGTGKSQTITAMIANALTKGKTVLFVAEKMAALEVVQKRLAALGIEDFCLELHSNKATKKAVLDQLKKTLEIHVYGLKTEYDQKIEDIRRMRKGLDAYAEKLHVRREFGKSLKELIDIYETIPDHNIELRFSSEYASTISQSDLDNQKRLLEQLVAAGRGVGHPHNHPLSAVHQTVYTQTLKMDLEGVVQAYKSSLDNLRKPVEEFIKSLSIESPVTKEDWENISVYARSVISSEEIPSMLLNADNLDKEFDFPLSYLDEKGKLDARKGSLLQSWKESFLQSDMSIYRAKYDEANKKLLGKGKAISNLVAEIQSFASFSVSAEQIPAIIADIEMYQKQAASLNEKSGQLSFEWKQLVEKYPDVNSLQSYKNSVQRQLDVIEQFSDVVRKLEQAGELKACVDNAKIIIEQYENVKAKEAKVNDLLILEDSDTEGNWLDNRIKVCDNLIENGAYIKDWIVYRQFDDACRKAGVGLVCDAYEEGLDHELVMSVYLRSIYKAIILSVIEKEPALNSFTGNGFNEQIVQFKKLDAEFMELTKDEMFYKLTHNLPSSYESVQMSKELNILRRAISSNGRGMSIRSLFDQIPHVLMKLCPCMLMSPISVAQYLSADNDLYDIVIFDEASQLPTCKAVGVLARGKNAVIVGDPNQMPPTSFFAGNTVDEDNLDIEDLYSILDDCLALGMPSAHLQWHYRSRHESLIAFSNHEFYENSMLTFPSVNDRERRVSLVKVDGFYDRKKGRVNEAEAKAIVAEIKRRYKDELLRNETIGVVTFNVTQQTLIEDMLQEEFQKDVGFDKWASSGDEALFVKNLENVQGDERDVILFSVAYGPDQEGKLSMNFGPLNKEGGWKRLNVAVSRARDEMIVFSTMTADMIDLKRTKAKGVESLKDFLSFAQKGTLQLSYSEMQQKKHQGILDRICSELEQAGYKYQKAVGHSRFKVDIAVINPFNEDEYLMGIMLDGDSYKQSSNTKDREVAQVGVLGGLGWKLHRIWTMDWWDNKQKEIDHLLQLLDEEKKKAELAPRPEKKEEVEPVVIEDTHQAVKPIEVVSEVLEDEPVEENVDETKSIDNSENEPPVVEETAITEVEPIPAQETIESVEVTDEPEPMIASLPKEPESPLVEKPELSYRFTDYVSANVEITPLSTNEYVLKSSMAAITEHLQKIVDAEAPISIDRLTKKVLRTFDIGRSSAQTIEATEKALKKVNAKSSKQNGMKFYWKEGQEPSTYQLYRFDANLDDKRAPEDISQEEMKNVVCLTLQKVGREHKDDIIKDTIRTMGYNRSGVALVEAVERGIKYGKKTGEIVVEKNMVSLP